MCKYCENIGKLHDMHHMMVALETLIGQQQRTLDLLRTVYGVPENQPVMYEVTSPTANTVYPCPPVSAFSVLNGVHLNGNGLVSLYIQSKRLPAGQQTIFVGELNGAVLPLPYRIRLEPDENLAISTNSSSGLPLAITYQPVPTLTTPEDLFTYRKGL